MEHFYDQIPKDQEAGIPSMHKPASREIISASAELCETEVCFLHQPTCWHERVTSENAQEST